MSSDRSRHHWWEAVVESPDGQSRLVVVDSARHPDGARVTLTPAEALDQIGADTVCTADLTPSIGFGHRGPFVLALHVGPQFASRLPAVWYAEVGDDDLSTLVAFSGAGQPAGRLVSQSELAEVWVDSDDQLGAVRWYPGTGEVDQIFVAPRWRRRHLATALIAAAGTLARARGMPRLWADGERTALGQSLRNSRSWSERTADLTHLSPPLTPPGDTDS